jgi:signal transduction histidine kinase
MARITPFRWPGVARTQAGRPSDRAGGRPGVVRALSLRLFAASALAFLVLYCYWGVDLYRTMNAEVSYRADRLLEERRAFIQAVVETAVNGAEHARRTVEARARAVIRARAEQALKIARHIWETRPGGATDDQAAAMIREALRPVRYDNGRGYYFIFDIETGNGILHADRPQLENQDMRLVRDADGRPIVPRMIEMIREDGAGYFEYHWFHPNRPGNRYRKISYVVPFEPLGWGIAIGDYLADMSSDVKSETLAQLEATRFGGDGYIFAGTFDGLSLLGPGKGQMMWSVEDPNGVRVVQELVAAARAGGGFVRYVRPALGPGEAPSDKLSYVLPVPAWRWYVGAGLSVDDINADIAAMQADIRREALTELALGTIMVLLLAAVSYGITLRSARLVGWEMTRIESFLADDGRHPDSLEPGTMRHAESFRLAQAIRGMGARRDAAEAALERQSHSLQKSNADLQRFAYVASHDLREPLRIVSSYVGLLRRRYRGRLDADADTFIDFATEGAQRMHDMIGDLLIYARVQRSDEPLVPVPLGRVIERARANLAARIQETDATVTVAPALPVVRGQEPLLLSLAQNLLENALKYRHAARPPEVHIDARRKGGRCILSVADNGIGIDPAFHDRVFENFQRLHPGGAYPGTGMGLSICQSIAESHGGRIWFESEPELGTTFFVDLPLADAGEQAAP